MDRPLVSLEPSTLQICYLCENYIKGKEKLSNITAAGIDTTKIYAEKWKTHKETSYKNFHLVWEKIKNVSCESLKINKLICHSQCRRDFTNDIKISRYNQLETILSDIVSSDTLEGTTMSNVKIRRIHKDHLKQDQCLHVTKLEKEKKIGAYEVASRVETKDGSVTSTEAMTRNENSNDPWLQTAAKCLKVSDSDMWVADVFCNKTYYDRFVYFYRKIPKENLLLNKEVSSQSAEKEFLVLTKRKILIQKNCCLLTDLVAELQQLYEMYCANENINFRDNQKNETFSPRKL